jgi:chloride channel 7
MPGTICPQGQYSDVAVILLSPKEVAIKALFSRNFQDGATFSVSNLLVSFALVFVLTIFTFGSAIPAGLFIPNILAGACLGRAIGELFREANPALDVHPGVYALVGSAGMLSGFSRMTISLTMIMLEITANMHLILPIMLSVFVAKTIADRFIVSAYDLVLELNPDVHMLEGDLDEDRLLVLEKLTVHDACTTDVLVLRGVEPMSNVVSILSRSSYGFYPVVDAQNHLLGVVGRVQLARSLSETAASSEDLDDSATPTDSSNNMRTMIAVMRYADAAPMVVHWSAPLAREFRHFRTNGMQHLCVVDEEHKLQGFLTRTDFSRLCQAGQHGRDELAHIVNRKVAAAAAWGSGGFSSQSQAQSFGIVPAHQASRTFDSGSLDASSAGLDSGPFSEPISSLRTSTEDRQNSKELQPLGACPPGSLPEETYSNPSEGNGEP